MATNNAVNLKSSGIVSYDGAGAFTALANPLTVSNGGSGVSSNTAFAVLTGGTTSTGAIQSVASVGTAGQILTSNGAGTLPTFQTAGTPFGYEIFTAAFSQNPADSTVYYMGTNTSGAWFANTLWARSRYYIPVAGTITASYGTITVNGTLGSSENITLAIRVNNTTDTTVTSTAQASAADNPFSVTGLSISVSAGDYINFKWTGPVWTTNPTTVRVSWAVLIQ